MSNKKASFKDNYIEAQIAKEDDDLIVEVSVDEIEIEQVDVPNISVLETEERPQQVVITEEAMQHVLKEQKEESVRLLETVVETNKNIVESIATVVANSNASNTQLINVIEQLSERLNTLEDRLDSVKLLESKIDSIKDMKIPAPIVNLTIPSKRIKKEVHRDDKGFITHVTEEMILDDPEDQGQGPKE